MAFRKYLSWITTNHIVQVNQYQTKESVPHKIKEKTDRQWTQAHIANRFAVDESQYHRKQYGYSEI